MIELLFTLGSVNTPSIEATLYKLGTYQVWVPDRYICGANEIK